MKGRRSDDNDAPVLWRRGDLFDIEAAYRYEEWLAKLLKHRLKKYAFGNGQWRLYRDMLDEFAANRSRFKAADFHPCPGDPLVWFPDDCPKMLFLTGRNLRWLKQRVMKKYRRGEIERFKRKTDEQTTT